MFSKVQRIVTNLISSKVSQRVRQRQISSLTSSNQSVRKFCGNGDERTRFFRKYIKENTRIVSDHLTPEIKLHLITPECDLYYETNTDNLPFTDPFWSIYWPGGQGVSRFILDNPEIVRLKRVLDFGSGCGASSIAALKSEASLSVANDIDEVAEIAAQMNAELNDVHFETTTKNLIGDQTVADSFDIIILGDVFYDEEIANLLIPWLDFLLSRGKLILIGDPGRHALSSKLKLKLLAKYLLPENIRKENHGFDFTNVWKFYK